MGGRPNERTEVPIKKAQDRPTYYGALNLYNKDFVLTSCTKGEGENTVLLIQHGPALNPDKKRRMIGDGARYHRCEKVHDDVNEVNPDLEEKIGK